MPPQADGEGLRSELTSWYQIASVLFRQRVPGRPPRPSESINRSSAMKKILKEEGDRKTWRTSSAGDADGPPGARRPLTRTRRQTDH